MAGELLWFTAPRLALVTGGALAPGWEVLAGAVSVEGEGLRIRLGEGSAYVQTASTIYGPDCEAWATLQAVFPESRWSVAVRENHFASLYGFYISTNGNWFLLRIVGGIETKIAEGASGLTLAAGNKIAIRAIGATLTCAVQQGTVTTLIHETTDSSVAAPGSIAFSLATASGTAIGALGAGVPETKPEPEPEPERPLGEVQRVALLGAAEVQPVTLGELPGVTQNVTCSELPGEVQRVAIHTE